MNTKNDIKIAISKPEDIAFTMTYGIWDQFASAAPNKFTKNKSKLFLWPNNTISKDYIPESIDVLVATIVDIKDITPKDRHPKWPVNQYFTPADLLKGDEFGKRYILKNPKRISLAKAKIKYPDVFDTKSNQPGVYVK